VLEIVIARRNRPRVARPNGSEAFRGGSDVAGLVDALRRHRPADAKEAADLEEILEFVRRHPDPFDRRVREGHLTGSAVVVSAAGDRVLLLHHRKLGRWLQPGGHAETGERDGTAVALREAREETGIDGLALHPTAPRPLDVDVHPIPARGGEPAHRHLDLRYLVVAPAVPALRRQATEVRALRWFAWDELSAPDLDAGLRRALRAAQAHTGVRLRRPDNSGARRLECPNGEV
jgi:8-oxo-dGTP pyrophosphatase MutT (NUDIX family)